MKEIRSKKVIRETVENLVDYNTGELTETKFTREINVSREPDYIKLYIADLIKLNDLPKSTSNILYSLLKNMTYDNEIIIIASLKRKISNELKISIETINKAVQSLNNNGIISRKDSGLYSVNPYLFGRGSWSNIREFRLKVTYNNNGRFVSTEVDKQGVMEFPDEE